MAAGKPDYRHYATLLEFAVLASDEAAVSAALDDALAAVREGWEPETTARNLRLIREARERRGDPLAWAAEVEDALSRRAGRAHWGGGGSRTRPQQGVAAVDGSTSVPPPTAVPHAPASGPAFFR